MLRTAESVLVTGGAGFIGRHLVLELLKRGHRVTVLDDLSTGTFDGLATDRRLELSHGSVLDAEVVRRVAQTASFTFHLAGVVGMRLAAAQHTRAYAVAVDGTRAVLEATKGPVILFSSSAVYGHGDTSPMSELDVMDENVLAYDGGVPGYATGKLEMERIGQEHTRRGRAVVSVRPFNVVGACQLSKYGMVLPTFVRRALAGKPLIIYDDGRQSRSFSHVETFVDSVLRLAESERAFSMDAPAYNVGAPSSTSILELAHIVLEELEVAVPICHVPFESDFPGKTDVRERVPDVALIEALLGPTPWPDVRKAVRDCIAHETGRRPGAITTVGLRSELAP